MRMYIRTQDHGWNDIVAKVSSDRGVSWGPMQIVYSESSNAKEVCIGNPSPVALQVGHHTHASCHS